MDKKFLFEMLNTHSVSGNEFNLQKKIKKHTEKYVDLVESDLTGNVISIINPDNKFKVMLASHIDEIGFMVKEILQNGTILVSAVGGVRPKLTQGRVCNIITKDNKTIKGVFGVSISSGKIQDMNSADDLFIDVGATSINDIKNIINIGDYVVLNNDTEELFNNKLTSKALDDKIGSFIVLEVLKKLKEKTPTIGVYGTTTVGEETTKRGAYFASSRIKPNFAIAIDVTYANDQIKSYSNFSKVSLGKGPVLTEGSIINKNINSMLRDIALENNINIQTEVWTSRTGTDADQIHFTNEGVPTALVSIPLRYMHSPNEIVDLSDVNDTIELLVDFLSKIDKSINLDPLK